MIYLKSFDLVDESSIINVPYPFDIFPLKQLDKLEFNNPVTIFYGSNGSGKTTLLNIIAEKLYLQRITLFNHSDSFEEYVSACNYSKDNPIPRESIIITSDDVFNFMFNIRAFNQDISFNRKKLFDEYQSIKSMKRQDVINMKVDSKSFDRNMAIISNSKSKFVQKNLVQSIQEHSNGETALKYFIERINENALYLLDEPENSLSSKMQIQLSKYIEDCALGCNCQFLIATHSPFFLSMQRSVVYDLDSLPVKTRKWTELENVKIYREFFKQHEKDF